MPFTTNIRRATLCAGALVAALAAAPGAVCAQDEHVHTSVAAGRIATDPATGRSDRIDFVTFDFRAWLRRNGEWHVEGDVTHRGLRCATYEMGLRFGIGSPGCTNVEWVSDVRFVSARTQCNDAGIRHSGGDTQPELESRFREITCAQRVLRCTGNCQDAPANFPSDQMRRDEFRPQR